jgi:hypothetical protein
MAIFDVFCERLLTALGTQHPSSSLVERIVHVGFEPPYLSDFQSACDAGESIVAKNRVVPDDAQLEKRADDGEDASRAVRQRPGPHELRGVEQHVTLTDLQHLPSLRAVLVTESPPELFTDVDQRGTRIIPSHRRAPAHVIGILRRSDAEAAVSYANRS